ncbi:putative entry exclusion protein TrbK-alt [Sphingobium sp. B2]|uniref:putative entry exclusion protein TrbK-alt n=1 Tax=Sphingobium sp. B2 TaxID=2583228 RepID=UPI0011A29BD7|nr:putative entry exclusion protein TrbK-alt [Sphingobium sp. B2]
MSRTVKIAGACVLGGILLAVAVVSARRDASRETVIVPVLDETSDERSTAHMARCRTTTAPDAACDAAWEARRRHFFGQDARP